MHWIPANCYKNMVSVVLSENKFLFKHLWKKIDFLFEGEGVEKFYFFSEEYFFLFSDFFPVVICNLCVLNNYSLI